MFLGRIIIKQDKYYQLFLVLVGSFVVLVAPFVWEIDFSLSLPAVVAPYMNDHQGSIFPIFPWLGFLMFGAVAAFAHKKWRVAGQEKKYFTTLAAVGAVLVVAGTLLVDLPSYVPHMSTAIRANPVFFASRLGIVFLLLVACWYYAEWRKTERSFVLDVSKESLLVYTAHLLVIYGRFWSGNSPVFYYGESFSLSQAIVATIALILVMVGLAKVWGAVKHRSMFTARVISYAAGLVTLAVFVIRVY